MRFRISQLEAILRDKEVDSIKKEAAVSFLKNFKFYFNEWDTRKRKLLLEAILEKVIVYDKERASLTFSIPLSYLSNIPIYVKEQPPSLDVPSVSAVIPFVPSGGDDGI